MMPVNDREYARDQKQASPLRENRGEIRLAI
jgi:hypothetical protein